MLHESDQYVSGAPGRWLDAWVGSGGAEGPGSRNINVHSKARARVCTRVPSCVAAPLLAFAPSSPSCPTTCTNTNKQTQTEFKKVSSITALGFLAAGFVGFFIKLIFIVSTRRERQPPPPPCVKRGVRCFRCGGALHAQVLRRGGMRDPNASNADPNTTSPPILLQKKPTPLAPIQTAHQPDHRRRVDCDCGRSGLPSMSSHRLAGSLFFSRRHTDGDRRGGVTCSVRLCAPPLDRFRSSPRRFFFS